MKTVDLLEASHVLAALRRVGGGRAMSIVCAAAALQVHAASAESKAAAPAPAAPRVTKTETMNFDSWVVGCDTLSTNTKRCFARQSIVNDKSKQLMVTLTVGPNPKGEAHLDVQVPTSTSIPEGVTLKLDPGGEVKLPIMFCEPASCVASVPFDAALSAKLQGATKATVQWASLQAGEIKVDFALKGAKEAVAALAK